MRRKGCYDSVSKAHKDEINMEDIDLRKYVMSANRCPACDSPHNSQYKMKDIGLSSLFRYFQCRTCKIKWREDYELENVEWVDTDSKEFDVEDYHLQQGEEKHANL